MYLHHNVRYQLILAIWTQKCITGVRTIHSHKNVRLVCRLADNARADNPVDGLVVADDVELAAGVHILWIREYSIIGGDWRNGRQDRLCRTAE